MTKYKLTKETGKLSQRESDRDRDGHTGVLINIAISEAGADRAVSNKLVYDMSGKCFSVVYLVSGTCSYLTFSYTFLSRSKVKNGICRTKYTGYVRVSQMTQQCPFLFCRHLLLSILSLLSYGYALK